MIGIWLPYACYSGTEECLSMVDPEVGLLLLDSKPDSIAATY